MIAFAIFSLNMFLTCFLHLNSYLVTLLLNTICRAQLLCPFLLSLLLWNSKHTVHWQGPRWQSGNTLASHLWGRGSIPGTASSGKAGSCLPCVGSLQYRTMTNCMYWFPLPFQLPVVIWPIQCWNRRKTPNKQTNTVHWHRALSRALIACFSTYQPNYMFSLNNIAIKVPKCT